MTDITRQDRDWDLIEGAIARLRARIMAIVFAAVGGVTLFLATVWLLIRGGGNIGAHLSLLGNYFPGYSVSWGGALLGLLYGALLGAVIGWSVASLYNRVSSRVPGGE